MSPSAPSRSGIASSSGDLRPTTVMTVDDQRATRMDLSLIINRTGDLQVTTEAVHGQDVLDQLAALLEERRPLPDAVLMGVRMPVLNGIDATARISQFYPSVRVLVLTTYDWDEFAFGALSAGASGFLLKDTRTTDLHQALRAVSPGDAILIPHITRELLNRHMLSPVTSPRQRAARQRLDDLSPREHEVADLVVQGLTNAEIVQYLVLAPDSVKKNVIRILIRLGLRDRVQLVIPMCDAQS